MFDIMIFVNVSSYMIEVFFPPQFIENSIRCTVPVVKSMELS